MTTPADVLEVHLEELGHHSWLKGLLSTLAGTNGSAQFRFVARPPGPDAGEGDHVVGDGFPVMRLQDLRERKRPNVWIETAEQRLEELDRQLVRDGWVELPGTGRNWWSRTYTRPAA